MINKNAGLYSSLPPNCIRLLRLDPAASQSYLGRLEIVQLDCAPPYYAVSHSWPQKNDFYQVQLHDRPTAVSVNVVSCVQRLRETGENSLSLNPPIKYVWIDSVCINQANISERSSQVAMMNKIYRAAVRTLIWLGPDTAASAAAWELLDDIYNISRAQNPGATQPCDIPSRNFTQTFHNSCGLPPWTDVRWDQFRQLMTMRLFSRIWIVQEVSLSRGDPLLMHGKRIYPWERLGWVAAWFRRTGYMRLDQIPEQFRGINTISNLRWRRGNWPVDALVSITQVKFKASDQRDKIFGLVGLATEYGGLSEAPDELRPDYESSTKEVYVKATAYMMQKSQSLALMTRAWGLSGSVTRGQRQWDFDLPSWTPDLSDFKGFNNDISTSLSYIHYDTVHEPAKFSFPRHYSASLGVTLQIEPTGNPFILQLHGVRMDIVKEVLPLRALRLRAGSAEQSFAGQTSRIISASLPLLEQDRCQDWIERIVKTTTTEHFDLTPQETWLQSLADGASYLYELLSSDEKLKKQCESHAGGVHLFDELESFAQGGNPAVYETLARNFGFDRAFLVTSGGRMGLGPSNIETGDEIAVLFGGDAAYCIRTADEGDFLFVGEAYVDGLMKGEAVKAYKEGLVQEEVFRFR